MLYKTIFISVLLLLSMGFEESQQYTFSIRCSAIQFHDELYEGNQIIVDSKQNFYHGAGYWKMIVRSNKHTVEAFRVINLEASEHRLGGNPDSTSRLIGDFTSDAFDIFKNEKVDIIVGYNFPMMLVAHDVDLQKDIWAMPKLWGELPKLTAAMLKEMSDKQ